MAYQIARQESTGLWLVSLDGQPMGRAANPATAISLAQQRVDQLNDPVTGTGTGTTPQLTPTIAQQLSSEANTIEQAEQAALANSRTSITAADAASGGTQGGQPPPAVPAASAGAIAANSAQGREGGNTQNPPLPTGTAPEPTTTTTNSGISNQTENIPAGNGNVVSGYETVQSGGLIQKPTSGTVKDDTQTVKPITGATTYNDGKVIVPNAFLQDIPTRENPLSEFASSSYTISIYLQTPESYRMMVKEGRRSLLGSQLLIQSGGAAANSAEAQEQYLNASSAPASATNTPDGVSVEAAAIPDLNRSPFFDVDFYIDDVTLKSYVTGTATGSAHNVGQINFRIIEPNGITLLDRLKAAVEDFLGDESGKQLNYAAQHYLMVIRFYGYDANGNIVKRVTDDPASVTSDPRAYLEKFIPFVWTECKFRVASKVVEYECSGVSPNYTIGFGAAYASIPFNMELSGGTLEEILLGPTEIAKQRLDPQELEQQADGVSTAAPSSAASAPGAADTVKRGLVEALNAVERKRAADSGFEPNQYSIKFVPGFKLESATLVAEGPKNKRISPLNDPTKGTSKNPDRGAVNNTTRNFTITAGTQIVQVINMLIQRSSYIRDQQLVVYDKNGDAIVKPAEGSSPVTQWFKIRCFVKPIKYDAKKNDYSYSITYVIGPYQINDPKSEYFPKAAARTPHKKYRYWFTGENSEVLSFEQDFNYLYYIAMSAQNPLETITSSGREIEKRLPQTRSDQPSQGDPLTVNEPASNLASILYSPADQGKIKVKVVGDPDWIQQNELFYNREGDSQSELAVQPFMPDGSINYDAQEPLFEIGFNTPSDYDFTTGTMEKPRSGAAGQSNNFAGSRIADFRYRANIITSQFSRGQFIQEIEGSLMIYQLPNSQAQSPQTADSSGPERVPAAGQPPAAPDMRAAQVGNLANKPGVALPKQPSILNYLNPPKSAVSINAFGSAVNQALAKTALPIPVPVPPTSNGATVAPAGNPNDPAAAPSGAGSRQEVKTVKDDSAT